MKLFGLIMKSGKRAVVYALVFLSVLVFLLYDDFTLNSLAGEYGEGIEMQQGVGTVSGNNGAQQGIETISGNSNLEEGNGSTESTRKKEEILSLIVPEKMEVIINPWEMEGRTQVYSEEYIIKNCGDGDGRLVLSVSVRRASGQDIEIWTDSQGIHEGEEKKIYLEMNFGEMDTVILAEGNYTYERILGAGEELAVWFSGAVNENVSSQWAGDEIEISIIYLWESREGVKLEREQM